MSKVGRCRRNPRRILSRSLSIAIATVPRWRRRRREGVSDVLGACGPVASSTPACPLNAAGARLPRVEGSRRIDPAFLTSPHEYYTDRAGLTNTKIYSWKTDSWKLTFEYSIMRNIASREPYSWKSILQIYKLNIIIRQYSILNASWFLWERVLPGMSFLGWDFWE
jgi:hypothetical protein